MIKSHNVKKVCRTIPNLVNVNYCQNSLLYSYSRPPLTIACGTYLCEGDSFSIVRNWIPEFCAVSHLYRKRPGRSLQLIGWFFYNSKFYHSTGGGRDSTWISWGSTEPIGDTHTHTWIDRYRYTEMIDRPIDRQIDNKQMIQIDGW